MGKGLGRGGGGKHLLDNFAVCCRNIAACVVDVASHHVVGEVGLQNNVLGVHMHLKKRGNGGKGDLFGGPRFTQLPGWVVEGQTERGTRGGGQKLCETKGCPDGYTDGEPWEMQRQRGQRKDCHSQEHIRSRSLKDGQLLQSQSPGQ